MCGLRTSVRFSRPCFKCYHMHTSRSLHNHCRNDFGAHTGKLNTHRPHNPAIHAPGITHRRSRKRGPNFLKQHCSQLGRTGITNCTPATEKVRCRGIQKATIWKWKLPLRSSVGSSSLPRYYSAGHHCIYPEFCKSFLMALFVPLSFLNLSTQKPAIQKLVANPSVQNPPLTSHNTGEYKAKSFQEIHRVPPWLAPWPSSSLIVLGLPGLLHWPLCYCMCPKQLFFFFHGLWTAKGAPPQITTWCCQFTSLLKCPLRWRISTQQLWTPTFCLIITMLSFSSTALTTLQYTMYLQTHLFTGCLTLSGKKAPWRQKSQFAATDVGHRQNRARHRSTTTCLWVELRQAT